MRTSRSLNAALVAVLVLAVVLIVATLAAAGRTRSKGPGNSKTAQLSPPATDDFRGSRWRGRSRRWARRPHRYAPPLWLAGPMFRYVWGNTPYYWNGPTPSYYGSYPYRATW